MNRRIRYQVSSAQEQFMVPLLATKIGEAIERFATGGKALDVGCGGQPLREILQSKGLDYTGADIQQNEAGTVDVVCAIDQPLPQQLTQRGPFQFIVCTEVLEHVADWKTAFENLHSLLAPGGRLLITCPQFYRLHEVPHDYWRPTIYALRYFGQRVGFKILRDEFAGDGMDVLGTALACTRPVARSNGIISRGVALLADIGRKAAFVVIRSGFFRARVTTVAGDLYLSNIIIFERPA